MKQAGTRLYGDLVGVGHGERREGERGERVGGEEDGRGMSELGGGHVRLYEENVSVAGSNSVWKQLT